MRNENNFLGLSARIFIMILCLCSSCTNRNPYRDGQEKLAEQLGVKIEDYHSPIVFPVGYYDTILKTGMSRAEVHKEMKGYQKVLHCQMLSEIYYYFSEDDSKAIRFEILYDAAGYYRFMQGEEPDSRTIRIEGCIPGLINEN